MNTKIIFFDIDGTVLSHRNYQILESTKTAIRKARENGHLTFINTGRTLSEIDDEIKSVGFDGLVCGCGTYISLHDQVLLHQGITSEFCKQIVEDANRFGIESVMEGTDTIYFSTQLFNPKLIEIRDRFIHEYHANVSTLSDSDIIFDKFCLWFSETADVQGFVDKYKDVFEFINRDNFLFLEVVPKGFSKASGIEYLITHLDIPYDNTYALGDSMNDLAMLNYVKHSIGMGNSEDEVKEVVSYLTRDVDDHGVAYALAHFNIIDAFSYVEVNK
jgi:HAD-superfamily hydrolase, subfamily IIB